MSCKASCSANISSNSLSIYAQNSEALISFLTSITSSIALTFAKSHIQIRRLLLTSRFPKNLRRLRSQCRWTCGASSKTRGTSRLYPCAAVTFFNVSRAVRILSPIRASSSKASQFSTFESASLHCCSFAFSPESLPAWIQWRTESS